jgi:hypothetical protein
MPKKLKVYGTSFGTRRRIVAAPSRAAAMRALGLTYYTAREYMDETGNAEELALAGGSPGVVFSKPLAPYGAPFVQEPPEGHRASA